MSDTALATVTKRLELTRGLQGSFTDPKAVSQNLQRASVVCHLVSPATSCGQLPEGTAVGMAAVLVDPENEVYLLPGQYEDMEDSKKRVGLGKVALDKIAQAAGVSWDPHSSGRTDDGSNPHYCAWRAVGAVRQFDGTEVRLLGSKEMDLRDGSPQCDAIIERCIRKIEKDARRQKRELSKGQAEKEGRDKARNQIREMRLHILGHAETKARLRAIRALGIRSGYLLPELQKPFVVAKLIWTGRSADPELNRDFAKMTATAMLGGTRALYGEPQPAPALPGPRADHGTPPPPLGSVPLDGDDLGPDPEGDPRPKGPPAALPGPAASTTRTSQEEGPREGSGPAGNAGRSDGAAATPPVAEAPSPSRAPSPARARPQTSEKLHIPGKKDAAKPLLKDAEEKDLRYWSGRLAEDLDEERSRRPAEDRKVLEAIDAELAWRAAQGGAAPANGDSPY